MLTFHSFWPILSFKRDGVETEEELHRSLTVLSLMLARREAFIVVIENGASWESQAELDQDKAAWWETHQAFMRAYCRAVAFVSQGGVEANPEPHYSGCATAAFGDLKSALHWASARLVSEASAEPECLR